MGEKRECPACGSYGYSIKYAVDQGEPCPDCGLSAAASVEIVTIRRRAADAELTAKYEAAVIRADKAEGERDVLGRKLDEIRRILDADEKDYGWPDTRRW